MTFWSVSKLLGFAEYDGRKENNIYHSLLECMRKLTFYFLPFTVSIMLRFPIIYVLS